MSQKTWNQECTEKIINYIVEKYGIVMDLSDDVIISDFLEELEINVSNFSINQSRKEMKEEINTLFGE